MSSQAILPSTTLTLPYAVLPNSLSVPARWSTSDIHCRITLPIRRHLAFSLKLLSLPFEWLHRFFLSKAMCGQCDYSQLTDSPGKQELPSVKPTKAKKQKQPSASPGEAKSWST